MSNLEGARLAFERAMAEYPAEQPFLLLKKYTPISAGFVERALRDEPEEVSQAVRVGVWETALDPISGESWDEFLDRAARAADGILYKLRKSKHRHRPFDDDSSWYIPEAPDDPRDDEAARREAAAVLEAVERLPATQREAVKVKFELGDHENLNQLAVATGRNRSNVFRSYKQGVERIRKILESSG